MAIDLFHFRSEITWLMLNKKIAFVSVKELCEMQEKYAKCLLCSYSRKGSIQQFDWSRANLSQGLWSGVWNGYLLVWYMI